MTDETMMVYGFDGVCLRPMKVKRPTYPPEHCKFINEDLECLGCGAKVHCIKPGHCVAVEGDKAYKP
jgi:hypothetical protein